MVYPFKFKAKIYNYDMTIQLYETGMGLCDSYANAAGQIENFYRDELISIEKIELFEDSTLILLPEEVCNNYNTDKYKSYKEVPEDEQTL